MDYWELRALAKDLIPRQEVVMPAWGAREMGVREKGRKHNYRQMDVLSGEMVKHERLLNVDEIKSFVEVSCRAAECPMPLNLDVWDGFRCPFRCRYCFANYWRSSLYSSFFDNYQSMGLRSSDPDKTISQIDAFLNGKGDGAVCKAMAKRLPLRFGIRFEDFLPIEGRRKVSLKILEHLAKLGYPVMINTKATLVAREDYVRALADNVGGSAVHITLLTPDEELSKLLDVASPKASARFDAARVLADAGVRPVLRVEPLMVLVNDRREDVDEYIDRALAAGVTHMTWDTYSYSALSAGIREAFRNCGLDFDRMFLLTSDAQWLGSLLLSSMMAYFRGRGLKGSTFDFGSVPTNDDDVCCSVDGYFPDAGFNDGNALTAVRQIVRRGRLSWDEFSEWVEGRGGWLSESLREDVRRAWNCESNQAYTPDWVPGIEAAGEDDEGNVIWAYREQPDFRLECLKNLVGDLG